MLKVITALENPILNNEIKNTNEYIVPFNDIQYQDGVLEILEKEKDLDFLILSSLLPGNLNIYEFIEEIKKENSFIEIIIFIENKNDKLEEYLKSKNIKNIFYNNQIEIKEIINLLNKKENNYSNNEIEKEIKILKEIILNNNFNIKNKINKNIKIKNENKKIIINKINYLKNKLNYFKLNIFNNNLEKNLNTKILKNNKIFTILGTNGVGKSLFSAELGLFLNSINKNKKIVIVDFDILNNSINTIFGVKKFPKNFNEKKLNNKINFNNLNNIINLDNKKELNKINNKTNEEINNNLNNLNNINNLKIKIKNNLYLICGTEILFKENKKINNNIIKTIFENLKNEFDYIIIDTSSECFFDTTKLLIQNSDKLIFLTEANIIDIKKSKRLIEIYVNNWNIEMKKINIIFNKYNKNCISEKILKKIFFEINILGKINFNKYYNFILNNNIKNNYLNNLNKKIKKDFLNIINNIFENKINLRNKKIKILK